MAGVIRSAQSRGRILPEIEMEAGMGFLGSLDIRRAVMIVGTLLIAFGVGHVMQSTVGRDQDMATVGDEPDAAPLLRAPAQDPALPVPPAATLSPMELPVPEARIPIDSEAFLTPDLRQNRDISPYGFPCTVSMRVTAAPAAMLDVRLDAPCRPDETVTFAHEGLTFTQATDGFGLLRVQIPALVAQAAILATFEDGEDVAQIATVSDLDAFDRVALQWTGPQALSLHALELGASYGDAGHVWTKAPKSTDRALLGQGGFLSRLGSGRDDIDISAEIYSFPSGQFLTGGVVHLIVEAEVTSKNCGGEVTARAFQPGVFGTVSATDVQLSMPECDAIGEILILKNLLQDMRLALR